MKTLSIITTAGLAAAATAGPVLEWHGPGTDYGARGLDASGTFQLLLEDAAHWDERGNPNNVVFTIDVNAQFADGVPGDAAMTGIGWDLAITSFDPSWLSHAEFWFTADHPSGLDSVGLSPGSGDDFPGTGSYSSGGISYFEDITFPDIYLPDGILRIELFESLDDVPGAIDALSSGTLTIAVDYSVPAPAGLAVLGLGLVAARRRR